MHLFWNICVQGFKILGTRTYVYTSWFRTTLFKFKNVTIQGCTVNSTVKYALVWDFYFVWFGLGFGLQNKYLYCRWQNCFLRLNRLKIQNYSITDLDLWFLSEDTSSIYIRNCPFIIIRWLAKTSHCAVWNMTDM